MQNLNFKDSLNLYNSAQNEKIKHSKVINTFFSKLMNISSKKNSYLDFASFQSHKARPRCGNKQRYHATLSTEVMTTAPN